jgi:hypothetical protein
MLSSVDRPSWTDPARIVPGPASSDVDVAGADSAEGQNMAATCTHLDQATADHPNSKGCEECLKLGTRWVHLRMCMMCGHIGCCDSSPLKHATAHFHSSDHPVIQSYEPNEDWWWCYVDEALFERPESPTFSYV